MFGLFRKKQTLPDLTPEISRLIKGIREKIEGQVAAFSKVRPGWTVHGDPWISLMTASYCWGFVSGALQVTGADRKWAGKKVPPDLAHAAMMSAVLYGVFGEGGTLAIMDKLPQMKGRKPPEDIAMLEQIGGADGMAMAEFQQSRWPGGGLYHFYINNVT